MRLAAIFLLVLLLPTQLMAASGRGLRNFIIQESYDKVMEALEDPETIKEALRKMEIEVVSFHVKQIDASVEKELQSKQALDLKDLEFKATAKFTAHLRFTYQCRKYDAHIGATVYRGPDSSFMQVELIRPLRIPQTTITCCWARIDILRQSKDSTLLKASLHLQATEPYRWCRLVRRIQHNIAQGMVRQQISQLLCQVEREIRMIVKTYEPKEVEFDSLDEALESILSDK